MIERLKKREARIGFFSVAHATYWGQFEGLLESMMVFHKETIKLVSSNDVTVIDFGMVDSNIKAFDVARRMKADNLDFIICNMITYATSSVFAPILQMIDTPIVLLACQPLEHLDYSKASTFMQLQNDNICSVSEFTGVAIRMGREIQDVIIGTLYDDPDVARELADWCDIAKVLHDLKGARFGIIGHVMEAMYDMHVDPTALAATFGIHIPLLEPGDLMRLYNQVSEADVKSRIALIEEEFDMPDPKSDPLTMKLTRKDLYQAARTSVALDAFVKEYRLSGLAYYYEASGDPAVGEVFSSLIVGNSLLNAQGIAMCGEHDIKTCVAMFIMDRLNIGGSFAEFHPFDFKEDFILVGHDGPHHIAIAEDKPILRSLTRYHGKPGCGASVEFKIKEGPITMLGLTQTQDGKFKFVIGEGESRKGPIPPTGNTNTRGFFSPNTKSFVKKWVMQGPTHHYSLGVGHRAATLQKIAKLLNIECVIVNDLFH